jgi:hypothetical protein
LVSTYCATTKKRKKTDDNNEQEYDSMHHAGAMTTFQFECQADRVHHVMADTSTPYTRLLGKCDSAGNGSGSQYFGMVRMLGSGRNRRKTRIDVFLCTIFGNGCHGRRPPQCSIVLPPILSHSTDRTHRLSQEWAQIITIMTYSHQHESGLAW